MYSHKSSFKGLMLALSISLICSSALAGGIELPDLGTVALGRGSAFVARADNLSAFYYNPAGLSKSKGPNLLIGGNLVNQNVDFLRGARTDAYEVDGITAGNPDQDYIGGPLDATDFASVSQEHLIGPTATIVFSWGDAFNVEGLALAGGLLTPSAFGMPKYPHNGAQRYSIRDANFLMVYPGAGISYAFNRYIQVGAVFLSGMAILEQSVAIRPVPQFAPDSPWSNERGSGDANLQVDVKDMFMPTGIIGVLSNPVDWLEIGVSVKLPSKVKAEGNASYTAPTSDLPDSVLVPGQDKVTLTQNLPMVVRAGARFIHERFDIEADFVWEDWSNTDKFAIDMDAWLDEEGPDEDGNFSRDIQMPDSAILKNFRDTYSVRLGGDVVVWPEHITVRLGGFYQSSAYPKNYDTFNLDFPNGEQFGLSGGVSWHTCKYLDVNFGYLHVFQKQVVVTEGIVQQQGLPLQGAEDVTDIGNTVNNGTYDVSMNTFGLSFEGHF